MAEQMFGGEAEKQRAALSKMFFCLKDSKNMIEIELKQKKARLVKINRQNAFPHNFQTVLTNNG